MKTEPENVQIDSISYSKCTIDGAICLLVYDDVKDETSVIDATSPYYIHAVTALAILEKAGEKKVPEKPDNIIKLKTPKLMLNS